MKLTRKIIVAEIDALAADLSACYEAMSPAARVNALRLAFSLTALRKHFAVDRAANLRPVAGRAVAVCQHFQPAKNSSAGQPMPVTRHESGETPRPQKRYARGDNRGQLLSPADTFKKS